VAVLKTLAVLIAVLGMALIESVRPAALADDDDGVGLFVGSARALPQKHPVRGSRR